MKEGSYHKKKESEEISTSIKVMKLRRKTQEKKDRKQKGVRVNDIWKKGEGEGGRERGMISP